MTAGKPSPDELPDPALEQLETLRNANRMPMHALDESEKQQQAGLPYRWTQTLEYVELCFTLPQGTRAKQVSVDTKRQSLRVAIHGAIVTEGELAKLILVDGSTWSIADDKILSVHLEKADKNAWWEHVYVHEPKIDTSRIAPEESKLSDLDGESRNE
ncbi:hypothetical protein MVES1_003553 [Malassezia vespertilionis]|uniref:uncharacterized protein n=1 Tax=Malassezia vespertilionis TaxID=2020962 RepID=UPI0024B27770|nr:uncharacterized protein MVES1_003553 [Malassezia vespertilionis]WFD08182.1 hypothetical protein MVES1_003553 [Malassezia vespertilionis]